MSNTILLVKNFGPLKDVRIEFSRFTFFMGPQGSGKSTVAKLYSMFLWLEKRLIRGLEQAKNVERAGRFAKTFCGYHRLSSYFYPETEIEYKGGSYTFIYREGNFSIIPHHRDASGEVLKVMYVPAERSFLSSLKGVGGLNSLPRSLQTFRDEYEAANDRLARGFELPIDDVRFEYDRLNKVAWLLGKDYKVRLSDASSGFQAVLPMLLVTKYLTDFVSKRHQENRLNVQEREKINNEVKKIVENPTLSPEVREAALAALSARFEYSGLVNIVEEPEENLYPESQRNVLYKLLEYTLQDSGNQLIITTHSPYMIDYLTLAVKGFDVIQKGGEKSMISPIVPPKSCIDSREVKIYELKNGKALQLEMKDGIPNDDNFLNTALADTNEMFNSLLDIEEGI